MRDTLAIGAIAGIAGAIIMHLFATAEHALGLINMTSMEVSGALLLNPALLATTTGQLVSFATHFMIGAGGGVLLAYFMRFAGKDYWWLKGLALAGLMLLAGMAVVLRVLNVAPELRASGLTTLFHIVNFSVYGLVTAYIINRFGVFRTARVR